MIVLQILKSKGSSKVETIRPDAPLSEAAARLSARRIGALIVSRDGQAVEGVISERDIVRVLGTEGAACLDRPVEAVMTRKVSSCAPSDKAVSVLARMTEGRFRHMPVLEDGKLAGVISIGDVVKARIEEVERENAAMADMISGA
ncbi:CBS domain-containing protein [Oceanicella actignis]|uniref:CBS domain-containing protein n=1 Tax=Oceanicella actignis TaxID=1189325 RepID=A0A1M7RUX1_9RHOB|nr:CBS domain-containing protein [Oceanicella actignis]SET03268.1 CBS domain-containing protein [Oceanicella actignis]SHN49898.1 CBS domain-containing protein [Oceanicella actignis]